MIRRIRLINHLHQSVSGGGALSTSEEKEGIYEKDGVLIVKGDEYIQRVASALSSPTRLKILRFLREQEADVGQIASLVGQSKANASAQVRRLEEAGLVRTMYRPGQRGVKKICKSTVREIRIILD